MLEDCYNLESITIPFAGATPDESDDYHNSLLYLFGQWPSYYNREFMPSLTTVVITGGVKFGYAAFCGFSGLTEVTIPATVNKIDYYAFYNCDSLEKVTFEGTINSGNFNSTSPFPGNLRDKFYENDPTNGTPGTYITNNPGSSPTWYRQ